MTGIKSGILGCMFGALGIVSFGLIFVPFAVLFTLISLVRSLGGPSGTGFAVCLLSACLTIAAVISSPSIWIPLGLGGLFALGH